MTADEVDATPNLGEVLDMMEGYAYDLWDAVFELVDNSFDSYTKHGRQLSRAGIKKWEINITLDNKKKTFIISDNAYGMDREELGKALLLAKANSAEGIIGKYGMGMKTASSWLGKVWTVKTKKLGSGTELTATVNIPDLMKSGSNSIPITQKPVANKNTSYTIIEIKNAPRSYHHKTQTKAKRKLEMCYQKYLDNDKLTINWKGEKLEYKEPEVLVSKNTIIDKETGKKSTKTTKYDYKIKKFEINGSSVSGRYGIYQPTGERGEGSQVKHAGLTMFYNNRVILDRSRDKWMERIFGRGSGDLARQRIFLKIDVELTPNALKTDFLWKEYTIEKLEKEIIEQTDKFILECKKIATKEVRRDKGELSEAEKKLSDDEIKRRLESPDMAKALVGARMEAESGTPEPSKEEIEALKKASEGVAPLKVSVAGGRPDIEANMGDLHKAEPFLTSISEPKKISVFINPKHPFYTQKIGPDPELYQLYLDFCIGLSLAKWTSDKHDSDVTPSTFIGVLDKHLRGFGDAKKE